MTALWQLYKEQQTTEIRNEIVLQYTGLVKKIVLRFMPLQQFWTTG